MPRASASAALQALSSRERELLRLLVRGYTPAAAARALGLPLAAVERCQARLCRKLRLLDRPVVYEYAIGLGLLSRNGKAIRRSKSGSFAGTRIGGPRPSSGDIL